MLTHQLSQNVPVKRSVCSELLLCAKKRQQQIHLEGSMTGFHFPHSKGKRKMYIRSITILKSAMFTDNVFFHIFQISNLAVQNPLVVSAACI